VWKTDPNTGRKGRECTDYKRLAVLVLPTQTSLIFGQPLLEPAFLRVPPASLNSLAIMGDTMASRGFHYSSYVTRITFDPQKAHPEMVFRPLQGLTAAEAPMILQMRTDAQVDRIVTGGFAEGAMRTLPGPQQNTGLIPAGQGQAPAPSNTGLSTAVIDGTVNAHPLSGVASPNPQPGNGSLAGASAPLATPASEQSALAGLSSMTTAPEPQSTATGLNGASNSGGATPAQQTQTPQNGDAGLPEATDVGIDARIANLMKRG
jgi:hypothetical protein